jgi:hypothetical protein
MGTKRWPTTRTAVQIAPEHFPLVPEPATVIYDIREVPDTTSCKHGTGSCETCGTSNDRDVRHRTKNGRGEVARLTKKTLKKKS